MTVVTPSSWQVASVHGFRANFVGGATTTTISGTPATRAGTTVMRSVEG